MRYNITLLARGGDGLNVAVCDDEDAVRKQLSALIAVERGVEAVSEFSTADELLASPEHYDLLFLDI